jgi:hypothetical protein
MAGFTTMLRVERDPDAGGEPEAHPLNEEGLAEAMIDSTCYSKGGGGVGGRRKQDGELIPTETSDDVAPAQGFL